MIEYILGVRLAPLDSKYLETIREWRNVEEIRSWCRQNDLISDLNQAEWYEKVRKDPSIKMYAVLDPSSEIVGVCGLTSIDLYNRRAEFSLYIAPTRQQEGFGRRALKCLVLHGFRNLGLNCIWGETFEGNPAAKMFEEIGFKKEGTRRQFYFKGGKFIDCHLYSILVSEVTWS